MSHLYEHILLFSSRFNCNCGSFHARCAANADCRLADWQVNEENFVVECFKGVPVPKV